MKKRIKSLVQHKFLYLFVFTALAFSACKKDNDIIQTPVSGLMAFNLIPEQGALTYAISNNVLTTTPLGFTNFTGTYLSVYSGNREVTLYKAGNDSSIATTSFVFEPTKYYSLFALGAGGHYSNLIVDDNLDTLSSASGQAYVRYINAIPDSSHPMVTISAGGSNVVSKAASFGSISNFETIAPGDISISVTNESSISASRTITVEKDKVYTLLLMGIPNEADTAKAVQIKYIQNGTLSPTP